jgi:hypothetical protein
MASTRGEGPLGGNLDPMKSTGAATAVRSLVAVIGPGLLPGLSDDAAPGTTTGSVLGTNPGHQLLWVPLLLPLLIFMYCLARDAELIGVTTCEVRQSTSTSRPSLPLPPASEPCSY